MRFKEGIILNRKRLSPEYDKIATSFLDSLPLVLEGVTLDNVLTNLENPALLELSVSKGFPVEHFDLEPKSGFKVRWYFDRHLVKNEGYEIPFMEGDGGNFMDSRPNIQFSENFAVDAPIGNKGFRLNIYLTSKEDI